MGKSKPGGATRLLRISRKAHQNKPSEIRIHSMIEVSSFQSGACAFDANETLSPRVVKVCELDNGPDKYRSVQSAVLLSAASSDHLDRLREPSGVRTGGGRPSTCVIPITALAAWHNSPRARWRNSSS